MAAAVDDARGDVPFYVTHAREAHGAVLVAGCEAGRILLPVAKSGADADGFDPDAAAVDATRAALAERGLVAEVWVATLPAFTCRRRYAGLLAPGPSWRHAAAAANRAAALRACRAALAPGGWIVGDLALDAATPSGGTWAAQLAAAGFVETQLWGDFREAPIDADAREIVWRAVAGPDAEDSANRA